MHKRVVTHILVYVLLLLAAAGYRYAPLVPAAPPPPPYGIVTSNEYTVEELIRDIFVAGTCDNVSNIEAIGDTRGIGYFEDEQSTLDMSRGIILATGPIEHAAGPNEATDRSGNFNDSQGDPDLSLLSTFDVRDAVGIAFDFVPLDSTVSFSYVFASEEYCEFAGSIYNDVFGFFVSGPGINGNFSNQAENVALIPGTNDFVSINNVNHQENESYYVHNELNEDLVICNTPPHPGAYLSLIEYDGFTVRLTAKLNLVPCETYRIRLVVSDVGDNFFDSAVFLEAGSFDLGGEVSVKASPVGASALQPAEEGCGGAAIIFERPPGASDEQPVSVNYIVHPSSTATQGEDFAPLPGYVTIPAGSSSVSVPVTVYNDGIPEPQEHISVWLDIPCACYADSTKVYLQDSPPLQLQLPDAYICEGGTGALQAGYLSGTPPYTYAWSTGSNSSSIHIPGMAGNSYALTVTDACGNVATDTALSHLVAPPTAVLSGMADICAGDTAWLPLQLSGSPPWEIKYLLNGEEQPALILDSHGDFPATLSGAYQLTEVFDAGCSGEAEGSANVTVREIRAVGNTTAVSCFGAEDGRISVVLEGGSPPYDYFWLDLPVPTLEREGLTAGDYVLAVADAGGCQQEFTFSIGSPAPIQGLQPDCERLENTGELALSILGGSPPFEMFVDGQLMALESLPNLLRAGQAYNIRITDSRGCTFSEEMTWPAGAAGYLSLPPKITIKLGEIDTLKPLTGYPLALIDEAAWLPAEGLSCTDCVEPVLQITASRHYTFTMTDIYGCQVAAEVFVEVDERISTFVPTAFSPNGDQVNDLLTVFANDFQVAQVLQFQVFDRWGGMMYEARDFPPNSQRIGWDGTFRGSPMNEGVYTYVAKLLLSNGNERILGGHCILMR